MVYVTEACLVLLVAVLALTTSGAPTETHSESQCYVCSSYMDQCKDRVSTNREYVHKTKCKTSCFVRKGNDDAIYRGCFDGYLKVDQLKDLQNIVGCKNQTWNNQALPWCMCKGDLCNAESLYTLGYQSLGKQNVNAGFAKEGAPAEDDAFGYYPEENYVAPFQAEEGYEEPKQETYQQEQYQEYQVAEQYPAELEQYPAEQYYAQQYPAEQQIDVNHAAEQYYGYQDQPEQPLDDFVEHFKEGDETEYDPYNHPRDYAGENQVQEDYPPEEYQEAIPTKAPEDFPQQLAARIQCAKTGFYQNPDDCRTFVACILDPHYHLPYMHLMRCPDGLVWDNKDKICMDYSTTCNIGGSPVPAVETQESDYYAEEQQVYYEQPSAKAADVQTDYYSNAEAPVAYYEHTGEADYYATADEHASYYQHPQSIEAPAEPAYYEPIDAEYQPK